MLEHPLITRLRATGVSEDMKRARYCCWDCGCGVYAGDGYYCVAGNIYCEGCIKSYREEVTV